MSLVFNLNERNVSYVLTQQFSANILKSFFVSDSEVKKCSTLHWHIIRRPGANVIKLFTSVIYKWGEYFGFFIIWKPLQPSLKLASKVEAYPNEQSRVFLRRIEEKETLLQNL
jgi:hypothetical protein